MEHTYANPVLPGFYPDPSCILVGDTFYMINSSFQFFPGLPIHTSKDLVNWELAGHAICRPGQLSLNAAITKVNNAERREFFTLGLYAPTIRWHKGKFYIVCTNLYEVEAKNGGASTTRTDNFLITCTDVTKPETFSDPLYFEFYGIDPSLLFDDDGKVYVQGSYIYGYHLQPATVIRQVEIDVETGLLKTEWRDIWNGSGGKVPEGPHLYKKDGVYWLLIAEGGTHRGHKITMARSSNVWGPFESCERNPVLTAQEGHAIQCVGHGELFQDSESAWWCCMLARREISGAYPLGRESFLVPVTWPQGDFPSFEAVELKQQHSPHSTQIGHVSSRAKRHPDALLSPHLIYLRTPDLGHYRQGDDGSIVLTFRPVSLGDSHGSPTFVGQRQTALDSSATVIVDLKDLPTGSRVGLSLYKDPYRYANIEVCPDDNSVALVFQHPEKSLARLNPESVDGATALRLEIQSSEETYVFRVKILRGDQWSDESTIGRLSTQDFSGDDFTGTVYGIYAQGTEGVARFNGYSVSPQ
ncbi:beta-xylosidase [Thozetella sp. PMI_491]|nr:beta-xylosidase [Thozetella sp. PMI_491]